MAVHQAVVGQRNSMLQAAVLSAVRISVVANLTEGCS